MRGRVTLLKGSTFAGSDYCQIAAKLCNGFGAYKTGEYFSRSVVVKLSEQSSEQSEDNSVDISRKDLQ